MKLLSCSITAPVAKFSFDAFISGLLFIFFVLGTPLYPQEPQKPMTWREAWRALDVAIRLYDEKKFEEAGSLFRHLRENAPEGEFDTDVLRLLEGTSFWKAENPSEARKSLEDFKGLEEIKFRLQQRIVAGDANLSLAEKAYDEAQESKDPNKTQEAKILATDAEQAFKSALKIDPGEDYSLTKFEKTLNLLKKIEDLEEKQKQQSQENQEDQEKQEDQEDQEQDSQQNQERQQEQDPSDPTDQTDQSEQSDQTDQSDQSDSSENQGTPENQEPTQASSEAPAEETPADYSEEQAQQLLDTLDEQERRQRRQFLQTQGRSIPVEKDW